MKYLALALLLLACENPVDHFTEDPDRGSHTVIPDGPIDSTGADTVMIVHALSL